MTAKKIEKLDQTQLDAIPSVRDLWIEIGLSTERVDFARAKESLALVYKCGGVEMPSMVLFANGPIEGFSLFNKHTGGDFSAFHDGLIFGSQDASWLCMYDFYKRFCGIELNKLDGLLDLARTGGWCYIGSQIAIIMDRPLYIKMDEDKRLHCESGPAIEYADVIDGKPKGTKVYAWHGQRIPGEWIEDKASLTASIALTWGNVEQRRAACEIIGWNNILKELNAKVIQADEDPEIGTLLEVEIPQIGTEKFLRVRCGTGREFALPVPPDMKTALQANAWTYGLKAEEYKPEFRT